MEKEFIYNFSSEPTGTHMLLLNQISVKARVLDVGCAAGYLGNYLVVEKQCEVWGIEPDSQACAAAQKNNYTIVINKNIEEALSDPSLSGQKFDFILLGDVLEHVVRPDLILQLLKPYIKDGGKLLVSLPNVGHYSIRLSLLRGNWDPTDAGIMDRTHLHFYTLKTATELLARSGWKIETVRPRGDLERWFRKIGLEVVGRKLQFLLPKLFSVQFIFRARL